MVKEILDRIAHAVAELKDFQRATVEHVYQRLYTEGRERHLVADEVGLGKTIVAKGVIAKALAAHLERHGTSVPFKVVYICSNQGLARQNLRKLNLFKDPQHLDDNVSRLVFLAYKERNVGWFRLSTLTPSTSFNLTHGQGLGDERRLMWYMLSWYAVYSRGKRANGLELLFKGTIGLDKWRESLRRFEQETAPMIRPDARVRFKTAVQDEVLDLDKDYRRVGRDLDLSGSHSLQDVLIAYAELLRANNLHNYPGYGRLVSKMRMILTHVCLSYLDADLFILDEFQRFKDLVDQRSAEPTDAALIARKVFDTEDAKVLLLSATPFKPYTTDQEAEEHGEVHHKEFEQVLHFLFDGDPAKLGAYLEHRDRFAEVLRQARKGAMEHGVKQDLEQLLREVISRTERLLVSQDKDTLVKTITDERSTLLEEDIWDFVRTDRIVQALKEVTGHTQSGGMDFSRSSPSPFSFLDNYQVKRSLTEHKDNTAVRGAVVENAKGWLDLKLVGRYRSLEPIPNNRMRVLMDHLFPAGMQRMLWLPATLPYYEHNGAFRGGSNPSKILLFSRWRMVPRAISSLISYEAERLTIADPRLRTDYRQYWPTQREDAERAAPKKPTPRLVLKLKGRETAATMSGFALLYPSMSLADALDLRTLRDGSAPITYLELRKRVIKELTELFDKSELKTYCKQPHESANWYWAAPLLLDKHFHSEAYHAWLGKAYRNGGFVQRKHEGGGDGDHDGRYAKSHMVHMVTLKNMFSGVDLDQLGQFPEDLLEVLANMVLASPAVCALRMLRQQFSNAAQVDVLNAALDIAAEFNSLFDKPTSICIVDLTAMERGRRRKGSEHVYWRDVLDYCVDGNLQSMLDEFAHLIRNDHDELDAFMERIANAVNIRTSTIDVDDAESFLSGAPKKKLRCHFALEFGGRSVETESGLERAVNVLDNFNSPFWPFVLASTSIGQEGLDFHLYCRKVVHWNLPSNAIDLEQREGRVNRYKGLVIRQNLVSKYQRYLCGEASDPWERLFVHARQHEGVSQNKAELVPYWHLECAPENGAHIERIHPLLPFSMDIAKLDHLLWVLTLYRLALGQPRQEELLNTLFKEVSPERLDLIRKELMIDLSPISHKNNGGAS